MRYCGSDQYNQSNTRSRRSFVAGVRPTSPDGELQISGAGTIEQPHQSDGDGTEIGAAFGGADQQDLAGGSRLREAVRGAMLVSCRFCSTSLWTWATSSICAPLS